MKLSQWDRFVDRRREAKQRGKLRGIGMAFVIEAHGLGTSEEATVEVHPDGRATLLIGTMSNGQGHETTYAQIVAADLGLAIDDVDVIQGDTDIIPTGNGTGASRSITVGGAAVRLACYEIFANAKKIAARMLQTAPERIKVTDGIFPRTR